MKTFSDTQGRSWNLELSVRAVERVRDLAGFDLLDIGDRRTLAQLVDDPVTLCNVVYALVKPAADESGVSDEAFGSAMGGDAIDQATDALLEELVDFFPSRRRPVLQKLLAKVREMEGLVMQEADRELDDPALMDRVLSELRSSAASPGSSAGSSASIRAR